MRQLRTLPSHVYQEFAKSAIPSDLVDANIAWVEGDAAVQTLAETAIEQKGGHASQYVTGATARILDRYEFARAGGWVAYGCTIDGKPGEVAYFKPVNPRNKTEQDLDFSGSHRPAVQGFGNRRQGRDEQGRSKKVKYETPQGCPGLPLLAWVPWQYGLKASIRDNKGDRYAKRFYETYFKIPETAGEKASQEGGNKAPNRSKKTTSRSDETPEGGGKASNDCELGAGSWLSKPNPDPVQLSRSEGDGRPGRCPNPQECERSKSEAAFLGACERGQWGEAVRLLQSIWAAEGTRKGKPEDADCGRIERLGFGVDSKFWTWWQQSGSTFLIAEGLKKAESLIAQGIPAAALRGITMWHKKGGRELHDALAEFATPGRTIYICFDQDTAPKTVAEVRKQAQALGAELEKLGCQVRILHWDNSLGKGIDDALARLPETDRWSWVSELLEKALTPKQYRRFGLMARAFAVLDRLEALNYPVERETTGNYLPVLPALEAGTIHVLDAGLGSGKTVRIGADWVAQARSQGWFTVALAPMNSLGKQTAQRWKLPHVHDFAPKDSNLLWTLARSEGGVAMCPDSLHRLPGWVWQQPVLLVLDEANQICQGLSGAGTLGDRQSEILKKFTGLAEHATATGAIVMGEDGLADRAVRLIHQLSQARKIRVLQHKRHQEPWNCTMYSGQLSGYRARLLEAIGQGERVLFVTSSQREGQRLERAISKLQTSQPLAVTRIDSTTNEGGRFNQFFDNPDRWLKDNQPDVMIFTPSVKSGVSISEDHFDSVWGYFPSLAGDTHWQLLGRYRQPVPRHIFVPPFLQAGGDESIMSPRRIKQRYQAVARGLAGVFELGELLEAREDEAEHLARIENAILDYHATQQAVQGAQKAIAHDYLLQRLQKAGHQVSEDNCSTDKPTSELWKQVQEEIWRQDAAQIAGLEIEAQHDEAWAHQVLGGIDSPYLQRLKARKVLWRLEFPGVMFDDPLECYEGLCLDYGAMRRGVLLQARAENLEATRELDRDRAQKILSADVKALHRLPKEYAKARLIAQLGVLELLDGQEYSSADPRAIAVKKAALYWRNEIWYWLRLNIREEQSPVEICNKLLRKFGLGLDKADRAGAVKRVRREGGRGDQDWIYLVDLGYSSTHARLLEASRCKLLGAGSHDLHNRELTDLQIMTTGTKTPIKPEPPTPKGDDPRFQSKDFSSQAPLSGQTRPPDLLREAS